MSETIVEYEAKNEELLLLLDASKTLKIKTDGDFDRSAGWYATCVNNIEQIKKRTEKAISEAHQLHKTLCKERKDACDPWEKVKDRISKERNNYQVEQEYIRMEAQRKAEAVEAEKKEKERQKLLEQAIKLEEKGKLAQAEAKLEQAENVYDEPVFVPSAVEKKIELSFGGSVSSQRDFDVEVIDVKAICKAVADGHLPVGIIEIRNKELKEFCKLKQIENGDIEGLRINIKFRNINRK